MNQEGQRLGSNTEGKVVEKSEDVKENNNDMNNNNREEMGTERKQQQDKNQEDCIIKGLGEKELTFVNKSPLNLENLELGGQDWVAVKSKGKLGKIGTHMERIWKRTTLFRFWKMKLNMKGLWKGSI